jgi:hypothetical protein
MDVTDPTGKLLDWHQARRVQGVPTLSVLAGPIGLGVRAWRAWAGSRGSPVSQTARADAAGIISDWIEQVIATGDLTDAAVRWLADAAREFPETDAGRVGRMTRYDLDQLWKALPTDTASPTASAAIAVLTCRAAGRQLDAGGLLRALAPADPFLATDGAAVARAVCGLLPERRWPALLVAQTSTEADPSDWFADAARTLEPMTSAVPRLPVAVAVVGWPAETPPPVERPLAWAREGIISVRGVAEGELLDRLRRAGVEPLPQAQTVRRLTGAGLAEEAAAAFVGAAAAVRRCRDGADEAGARSAAERFLFEQLESLPQTAGLFRLNRPLGFAHGPRPAEADLSADRPKVVVEVDGGRYHLNPEQYRRDRRKDWLYQRHGYLVLRFLAEDVVDELETILNAILEAVALRLTPPFSPQVADRD